MSNHPEQIDSFSQIRGIGSGIERRLHAAHIHTFADLAAKKPAELAVILKGLPGLTKDSPQLKAWIRQAGELAAQQVETPEPVTDQEAAIDGVVEIESLLHNENFTVILRVGEDNRVQRMRVMHMQDAAEKAWTEWNGQELLIFIQEHAGLQEAAPAVAVEQLSEEKMASGGSSPAEQMMAPAPAQETIPAKEPALSPARGNATINRMEVATVDRSNPGSVMQSGQTFKICLGLDMSQVEEAPGTVFRYSAAVFARNLNTRARQKVAEYLGEVRLADNAVIEVPGGPLPAGVYRMEAVVMLSTGSLERPQGKRIAFLDGGIFQVT